MNENTENTEAHAVANKPPAQPRANPRNPAAAVRKQSAHESSQARPAAAGKSSTARRVKPAPAASSVPTAEQRRQMIAEAAYLRAEQRGFTGASAVDDWLAAEADVDRRYPAGN